MDLSSNCNIALTKKWSDDSLIELAIDVWTPHGYMYQEFYAAVSSCRELGQMMISCSRASSDLASFDFEEAGMHPAIRFRFLPNDSRGIIPIEIDLQVYDSPEECSRCRMRIEAEPGMLERFGNAVQRVASGEVGSGCKLNPNLPSKCVPSDEYAICFA